MGSEVGVAKMIESRIGEHDLDENDWRDRHRAATNVSWLMRLRWVAVVGQLLTIGASAFVFNVQLALFPLLSVVGFTALTNIGLVLWTRSQRHRDRSLSVAHDHLLQGVVMAVDLLSLTTLLFFAGGASNPFAIFYFVNLGLSAVILPARWGWTLTIVAIMSMIGLLFRAPPLDDLQRHVQLLERIGVTLTLQKAGLLVAFTTSAIVVIYFITRVTSELRRRELELRLFEQQRSRSEKLEALGTLAAGAGHELATPLSTIAVVSKELTRHLQGAEVSETVIEDVTLIRSEVDHCRTILDRMTGNFDQERAEEPQQIRCSELLEHALAELSDRNRVDVSFHSSADACLLRVPLESISQAIRGLIQNGLDASNTAETIQCRATVVGHELELVVEDRGIGMSNDVLERAGQPFFTTKEPGQGMGLGLFLTRSVVERQGGSLNLQSEDGKGVTAILRLPVSETTND